MVQYVMSNTKYIAEIQLLQIQLYRKQKMSSEYERLTTNLIAPIKMLSFMINMFISSFVKTEHGMHGSVIH